MKLRNEIDVYGMDVGFRIGIEFQGTKYGLVAVILLVKPRRKFPPQIFLRWRKNKQFKFSKPKV